MTDQPNRFYLRFSPISAAKYKAEHDEVLAALERALASTECPPDDAPVLRHIIKQFRTDVSIDQMTPCLYHKEWEVLSRALRHWVTEPGYQPRPYKLAIRAYNRRKY